MQKKENTIFLLLGGNLGEVSLQFEKAKTLLVQKVGPIVLESKLYQSEAWGFTSENVFLNQVIQISTSLSPQEVLKENQHIEKEIGRTRTPDLVGFESRLIDIDILYFNGLKLTSDALTIPHYALHERRFTLLPLAEIAPNYIHPSLNKTNAQLLVDCTDYSTVTPL
jgi:2-amino-4-hydroxy-6-hydroxymethyldihydropteridine diphosphokinase